MIMEMSLKRLDGVNKVAISTGQQMFAVFFDQTAKFDPKGMRDAVGNASVKVLRFHLQGRGRVQQEGDKQFISIGNNKDRFLVVDSAKLPAGADIGFIGTVDDSKQPYEIKIDDFKASKPEDSKPAK
jgi:hypothetical protein